MNWPIKNECLTLVKQPAKPQNFNTYGEESHVVSSQTKGIIIKWKSYFFKRKYYFFKRKSYLFTRKYYDIKQKYYDIKQVSLMFSTESTKVSSNAVR